MKRGYIKLCMEYVFLILTSKTQTTEDDQVILLKYIWKCFWQRTRTASFSIPSRSISFLVMDPIIVYLALIFAGPVPSPSPTKVPIGVHSKTF